MSTVTASSSHTITTWGQNGAAGGVATAGGVAIAIASDQTTAASAQTPQTLNATGGLTMEATGSFSVNSLADSAANPERGRRAGSLGRRQRDRRLVPRRPGPQRHRRRPCERHRCGDLVQSSHRRRQRARVPRQHDTGGSDGYRRPAVAKPVIIRQERGWLGSFTRCFGAPDIEQPDDLAFE